METIQISILVTMLSLSGWLHDGLEAFQAKKYPKAIAELSKVCGKNIPENKLIDIALYFRAQAYKENGDKEKALADLLSVLKKYSQSPFREKSRKWYLEWGGKPEELLPVDSPKKVWEQFIAAAGKEDMKTVLKLCTGMWKDLVMKETKGRADRLKREFRPDKLTTGEEKIGKGKEVEIKMTIKSILRGK